MDIPSTKDHPPTREALLKSSSFPVWQYPIAIPTSWSHTTNLPINSKTSDLQISTCNTIVVITFDKETKFKEKIIKNYHTITTWWCGSKKKKKKHKKTRFDRDPSSDWTQCRIWQEKKRRLMHELWRDREKEERMGTSHNSSLNLLKYLVFWAYT